MPRYYKKSFKPRRGRRGQRTGPNSVSRAYNKLAVLNSADKLREARKFLTCNVDINVKHDGSAAAVSGIASTTEQESLTCTGVGLSASHGILIEPLKWKVTGVAHPAHATFEGARGMIRSLQTQLLISAAPSNTSGANLPTLCIVRWLAIRGDNSVITGTNYGSNDININRYDNEQSKIFLLKESKYMIAAGGEPVNIASYKEVNRLMKRPSVDATGSESTINSEAQRIVLAIHVVGSAGGALLATDSQIRIVGSVKGTGVEV